MNFAESIKLKKVFVPLPNYFAPTEVGSCHQLRKASQLSSILDYSIGQSYKWSMSDCDFQNR